MAASAPCGRTGRRTKRGALAILDDVLLDALRALLTEHPVLEDPGNICDGGNLPLTSVAERVVDCIIDLRDLLDRYESAARDGAQPRASPNDDDILF